MTPRCLGEREERLGGLLGDEREVDGFAGEGALVGAAEQQQGLGEVDRSGVDGVEAVDELPSSRLAFLRATSSRVCVTASGVRSWW